MENYIVINGRKAELTEEQLKALGIETEKKSPFDRVDKAETYYYMSWLGRVSVGHEDKLQIDDDAYNIANYCTDKELLQQQAYREILNRLLWRYSMEHDGDKIEYDNENKKKHHIYHDTLNNTWFVDHMYSCYPMGGISFFTREIAQNAIEEIVKPFMAEHPDFKW